MAVPIVIPKLGMTVDEVTLIEWKLKEGERVENGDVVLVIETQKTEWNIEAEGSGFLHIVLAEGSKSRIGTVAGLIAETEEELTTLQNESEASGTGGQGALVTHVTPVMPGDSPPQKTAARDGVGERVRITPVARKMAEEHMIDVTRVTGTGPGGRITREDMEKAISTKGQAAEEGGPVPETSQGKRVKEKIQLRGIRKAIAEHMYRSLSVSAQMTVMGELDMTETVRLREGLAKLDKELGVKISYIDVLVSVLARALMDHPDINCTLVENELTLWEDINVGVAVALGTEGLIVPVVKHADKKGLAEISREIRVLVDKAQSGKLTPDDVTGGTFTLTSLGRRGVSTFQTPILNQPESAILATGPITDRPVVREGQIVIAPIMTYSMTFDHRAINGFGAEAFMGKVQKLLTLPGLMLV
jgi:pyruvate/2-oxoglutarate dehydrogenase complex dihydrolipoamide acyltransferase (E2) component